MKTTEKPMRFFEIELKKKLLDGSPERASIVARYAHVNHRGDLMFSNGTGFDPCLVAAFNGGCWVRMYQKETHDAR